MVGRGVPFTCTTEELLYPVPLTVSVKLLPKAKTGFGEMLEMVGTGLLTAKLSVSETPPPGPGLATLIESSLAVARSEAGMAAVNRVPLTNVVGRVAPFTRTTEVLTKLLPVSVSVNPPLPAMTLVGDMLVSAGTGLLIVNVSAELLPPVGLFTVMESCPAVATSAAVSDAVNCVPLTNVVVRFAPLT